MKLLENSYIAYVNLDHRTDRRDKMLTQFAQMPFLGRPERIRGMYPNEWPAESSKMTKMLSRPQVGAIGCFFSQLKIMQRALEFGQHAFVMEDDLQFCSDLERRLEYINTWTNSLPPTRGARDWDIIWLGGTFHVNPPWWHRDTLGRDAELTDDPRMVRTYGSFCTYAYIVNAWSIQKVIDLLWARMPESIGIDESMIKISPQLKTYAFVPGCVIQYDNISDQVPSNPQTTEFSRFINLNGTTEKSRYWYQDRMEDFDPLTFDWAEARV
jgi:GR25 family glycosyltransferase involved in LPS biosynthesis